MSKNYLGCPSPLRGWLMLGAYPIVWIGTAPILVIGIVFPGPEGVASDLRLWFTGGASAVIEIMFSPRRIISPSTRFISFSGSPIKLILAHRLGIYLFFWVLSYGILPFRLSLN